MIDFSDVQRVTPKVLQRLNEMASLPAHGVVAGQSVASLMYEELGLSVKGPVNDIDVFVSKKLPPDQRHVVYTSGAESKASVRSSRFSYWKETEVKERKVVKINPNGIIDPSSKNQSDENHSDEYNMMRIIAQRGTLSVLRTYRRDLLNYTLIDGDGMGPSGFVPLQVAQALVNGFDLNCVAIGIDLNAKRAVCTEDFIEFLNTATLKPQSYRTPGYTLIRLAKKVLSGQMNGMICDFKKEQEILLCANELQQEKMWSSYSDATLLHTFGPKYLEMIKPYEEHMPPFEQVRQEDLALKLPGLWGFTHQENPDPKVNELANGFASVHYKNTDFTRSILFTKYLSELWSTDSNTRKQILTVLKNEFVDHFDIINTLKPQPASVAPILSGHTCEQTGVVLRDSGLTPGEQHEAVALYNALSADQLDLFGRLCGEIDEVKDFCTMPERFYRNKFLQLGVDIFNKMGSRHATAVKDVYPIVMQTAKTDEGRILVRRSLENTWEGVNLLPETISKEDYVNQIIRIALGDDLKVLESDNTKMIYNIIHIGLHANTELPLSYPSLHASRALHKILRWRAIEKTKCPSSVLNTIALLLDCCSDDVLTNMKFYEVLETGAGNVIAKRLLDMSDVTYEKLKEFNFMDIDTFFASGKQVYEDSKMFFEHVSLTRALGESNKNKSKRRM